MNLYTQKKRWKFWLFVSAVIAFVAILYYSNLLLKDIAREERTKVTLWAEAVKHKAELVNSTTEFFDEIKIEEAKRATQLAKVLRKLYEADLDEDLTFYVDMLQNNKTIPLILTSRTGEIDNFINIELPPDCKNVSQIPDIDGYTKMDLRYDRNNYVTMYYKESKIYTDLRVNLNQLQESFFKEVVINAASIPVIITDETKTKVVVSGNLDAVEFDSPEKLANLIGKMRSQNDPIDIMLPDHGKCYVFYKESPVLTRLRYFPYIQFVIILVFIIVAYLLFSFARRSEQNRVWVGMSKETAHQLGTPISSLMAWTEILRASNVDASIVDEINKDVTRLDTIAQRFSKIGSVPELAPENLVEVIRDFTIYLRTRISRTVTIEFADTKYNPIILPINRYLFEWVVENLCKNAVDAMEGSGKITIEIIEGAKLVHIDITDTGKGIPPKKQKTIFKPGYTSKKRGWGLGLTLAQRIIKEYHKGKLFVKSSAVGKGTTMRITLKKQ
ncbi:MAG: HAMP domain-containing histidine kinase [Bacteroidales bacterium]|nr:HAMP domain-containing histidine kinase [Bacteroidales bacterium]